MSLKSFSHAYGESNYHVVLVPKYRRDIFKNILHPRSNDMIFLNSTDYTMSFESDLPHYNLKNFNIYRLASCFRIMNNQNVCQT